MTQLTRDDLWSLEEYATKRSDFRAEVMAHKKNRQLALGEHARLYFEDATTVRYQIQEMLRIERVFEAEGIEEELSAYNPLVPQGQELVATLMFEIDDPVRRDAVLRRLGGVEDTVTIEVGSETVRAVPDIQDGVERTTSDGKTSSIHFLHFPFTPEQIAAFRDPDVRVLLSVGHENYAHMAVVPPRVRESLQADFD